MSKKIVSTFVIYILIVGLLIPVEHVNAASNIPVTGFRLSKNNGECYAPDPNGKPGHIAEFVFSPSNATNQNLIISSSAPDVAMGYSLKNATGARQVFCVQPRSYGKATISVKTVDGGFTDQFEVFVYDDVDTFTLTPEKYKVNIGETISVKSTITPDTAYQKIYSLTSDNKNVVKVDAATGELTGVGVGTATITGRVHSNTANTYSFDITVTDYIPVTGFSLSNNYAEFEVGSGMSQYASNYSITPRNATNQKMMFSSTNPEVASAVLSYNWGAYFIGVLVRSQGETTITVTTQDGGFEDYLDVIVYDNVQTFELIPERYEIFTGESIRIDTEIMPDTASQKVSGWGTSNSNVARVDSNGVITGVGAGTATITSKAGMIASKQITKSFDITVKPFNATGLLITPDNATMNLHETLKLKTTVQPSNEMYTNVTWKSSDISVATVDDSGIVTGTGVGTATISATSGTGNLTAYSTINVGIPVQDVIIEPSSKTIEMHENYQLDIVFTPVNATNQKVIWSSSSPAVATVTPTGLVAGVAPGIATITATTEDGGFTSSSQITVSQPATGISVSPATGTLRPGNTLALTATVTPPDASNQAVTWSSSSPGVAVVDANGVVTAVGPGAATITVTAMDGNHSAVCQITVETPVESINVTPKTNQVEINESLQLTAAVHPVDATEQGVVWSSSDPAVATVDSSGKVTAHSQGTAVITATTVDGGMTDTAVVEVIQSYILLTNASELMGIANNLDGKYKLGNDIDLSVSTVLSLGSLQTPFTGELDGQGYKIMNLNLTSGNNIGLFSSISGGTVKNLELENPNISGTNNVGALAGTFENGVIENCRITGAGSVGGNANIGGLVGNRSGGTFQNNMSEIDVSAGNGNVGGLIGNNSGDIGTSYATGNVSGGVSAGGLVGISNSGSITESYATGNITATGNGNGGLVGQLTGGSVENTFAYGRVMSTGNYSGGLAGNVNNSVIKNSYAMGNVSSNGVRAGGLTGWETMTEVLNSYFNQETSGITTPADRARTSAELKQYANYNGWDMDNIWMMNDGIDYPYLRSLPKPDYTESDGVTIITTPQELSDMRLNLNGDYRLGNEIDMSGFTYEPVGNQQAPFSGSLDGNGHTIRNLSINHTAVNTGLFGYMNGATIENIVLEDVVISGSNNTGALAGVMEDGLVKNCVVHGGRVEGAAYVGGLVGLRMGGSITGNMTDAEVIGSRGSVGGLIGENNGDVTLSFALGDVKGLGSVGGLIGISNTGTIAKCYAAGDVMATGAVAAGGLLGRLNGGLVSDTFAIGSVLSSPNYNGGLVGYGNDAIVERSYAIGSVAVASSRGGLFGNTGLVNGQCYFNSDATGITSPENQARTMSEMKQAATYVGWDFNNTWIIQEGVSYPTLKALPVPVFQIMSMNLPFEIHTEYPSDLDLDEVENLEEVIEDFNDEENENEIGINTDEHHSVEIDENSISDADNNQTVDEIELQNNGK